LIEYTGNIKKHDEWLVDEDIIISSSMEKDEVLVAF
jgi:hypothetical protein